MRAVVQRVREASVTVGGSKIAEIGPGLLALIGISREDTREDLEWMARKIADLRVFEDQDGKMNRSLLETCGELLLVSQFTLYGDCRKGRRPSYTDAAPPAEAAERYDEFVRIVRERIPDARSGRFQAMMDVSLVNSGPVTLILDSPAKAPTRIPYGS